MLILGDVLAVVASLFGICLSAWAMILATAIVFPQRAVVARRAIAEHPWGTFGIGLLILATVGLFGLVCLGIPNPGVKLIGWVVTMGLLSIATIGAAGLSAQIAYRMTSLDPELNDFKALARSAGLLVVSGLVPLLGWFFIVPVVLVISLGAGARTLAALGQRVSA